jgi:hypothetical protein
MQQTSLAHHSAPTALPRKAGFLRQKLPYLAVLVLAAFGVAYTSVSGRSLFGYWEFLAIAIGVACVVIGWGKAEDGRARMRIAWTQGLQWLAFLIAMNVLLLPSVNTFLNAPATGLAMLLLLALGTFVAGIHVSADIAVLGVALALTVPAIAWFKQSALLLILIALLLGSVAVIFWSRLSGHET